MSQTIINAELLSLLWQKNIDFSQDVEVSSRSSFKIGGKVALAIFPRSIDELIFSVDLLDAQRIKFEIFGNASNVLFAFEYYCGAFIFTENLNSLSVSGNAIFCEAGVSLTHLSNVAAANSLSGLEFAYGIPAQVGGAVYMNAGAYGSQVSEVLEYTLAFDRTSREIRKIYDGEFGYRKSPYMTEPMLVCLGASFMLADGEQDKIKAKMSENMRSRQEKQPLKFPSAGSYFKRPEGNFAGKLIEDCGLKGFRIGDAEVSTLHAGFIINLGKATYKDVISLEEKIKERVADKFGVLLEREVRLITD